jgi:hypothetical protein
LARIYKTRKYPFIVTNDLTLNPLNPEHKNTFLLIENKSKYLFSLNDLISIIETAIGNAPNFFSDPIDPANPYNNQKFTLSTLYNIYFKMKESGRLISTIFHFFFLENFDKDLFCEHYEPFLRENAIKKYTYNSPYTTLYNSIIIMLDSNIYTRKYYIHKEFPKELLVSIFRPFLYYFFIVYYDIKGTSKIYNYKHLLHIKLKKFYEYNPAFGRQYIVTTIRSNHSIKKEYRFNTKHISFYNIKTNIDVINTEIVFTTNPFVNTNAFINTINVLLGNQSSTNNSTINNDIDEDTITANSDNLDDDFDLYNSDNNEDDSSVS